MSNATRDRFPFQALTTGPGMDTIAASGGWRSTWDCFRCATISEAIMKAILSMALVLGVCGLAGAADDKVVDPVGRGQPRRDDELAGPGRDEAQGPEAEGRCADILRREEVGGDG